ncbi:hypothetical protein ACVGX7_00760, partial [Enterobacter hormaechei]
RTAVIAVLPGGGLPVPAPKNPKKISPVTLYPPPFFFFTHTKKNKKKVKNKNPKKNKNKYISI